VSSKLNPLVPKIVLIGGGKRVQSFYKDLLYWLQEKGECEVVALCNRTPEKLDTISNQLNAKVYPSPDLMIANEKFDAAVISVTSGYKEHLALLLAKLGIHLFLDSPVPSIIPGIRLYRISRNNQLKVEFAEDQSFSPEAQLQKKLLFSGEFGSLQVVYNHCKEIDYHALARLHNLINILPEVHSVGARKLKLPGGQVCLRQEIEFDNLLYLSNYTIPKDHLLRSRKDFQLICENGIIGQDFVDHEIYGAIEIEKTPRTDDGSPEGLIQKLVIRLNSKKFTWESIDSGQSWSRQHHGLQKLLTNWLLAINKNKNPLYGIKRGLYDRSILLGLSIARKTNQKIFPLILPILNKTLWKKF